jgi:hypothetical protein
VDLTEEERNALLEQGLDPADLYEPPLDSFGVDVVDRWFAEEEVRRLLSSQTKWRYNNLTISCSIRRSKIWIP